jgi:hypothetical protein
MKTHDKSLALGLQKLALEESFPERGRSMKKFMVIALAALLTTSCGGSYDRTGTANQSATFAGDDGSTSNTGDTGSSTDPVTTVGNNFTASYTQSFVVSGAKGTDPTATLPDVLTDSVLKVRVTAGPAGNLALSSSAYGGYSNYSGQYYCVKYTVEVVGFGQATTHALAVGGGSTVCPDADDSEVIDFSRRLTPGHGPVDIKVSAAGYDYYCGLLYSGMIPSAYYNWNYWVNQYCSPSLYPVYQTHTVSGSLEVEVNGSGI